MVFFFFNSELKENKKNLEKKKKKNIRSPSRLPLNQNKTKDPNLTRVTLRESE